MKRSVLRRMISCALVLVLVLSLSAGFAVGVSAATKQNVEITAYGQVVDTFRGVPAKYIPGTKNSATGTYCCAYYVKSFYSTVYGVTVSNLISGATPAVSESGYSFREITDGVLPGDVIRMPGHWAIAKAVDGKTLTLIEQNWKFDYNGKTYATINRTVTLGVDGVTAFRLYRNGQPVNTATASGTTVSKPVQKSNATASQVEALLFDAAFYASIYPDLQNAFGSNATALKNHWQSNGIREGRVASPFFDAKWYMANNPDVAAAYGAKNWKGAYTHFVNHGFNEGRQGSPYFSAVYYLNRYSDLKAHFGSDYLGAARHFLTNGLGEGRQASSTFSIAAYNRYNPDVVRAFPQPLYRISHYIHYVQYGRESRKCL